MTWLRTRSRRTRPTRQQVLPFLKRASRRDRRFKLAIAAVTLAALAGLVFGTPEGRYVVETVRIRTPGLVLQSVGGIVDRARIDAEWAARRRLGVEQTRAVYQSAYDEMAPGVQEFLRLAGMAPENAVIRWGNYDQTLVLPSGVFAPDDHGRSYHLRAGTRSIWLWKAALPKGLAAFFLVPETRAMRDAVERAGMSMMKGTEQTTNSWGCRGPEPDLSAPVRVLVLGDSFMEGLFLGDNQTPPECLRRALSAELHVRVSVLNTGTLGYSPEQYDAALTEYCEAFDPTAVIVSVFVNDFGECGDVVSGECDWSESGYWINEIQQYCRSRGICCLLCPAPFETQITGPRREGRYPGAVADLSLGGGFEYFNPIEEFINTHLEWTADPKRRASWSGSPLFNGPIDDGHFSAMGSEVWGRAVAHRLALVLPRCRKWTRSPRSGPGPRRDESSEDSPGFER